jgi:hypothetical protein
METVEMAVMTKEEEPRKTRELNSDVYREYMLTEIKKCDGSVDKRQRLHERYEKLRIYKTERGFIKVYVPYNYNPEDYIPKQKRKGRVKKFAGCLTKYFYGKDIEKAFVPARATKNPPKPTRPKKVKEPEPPKVKKVKVQKPPKVKKVKVPKEPKKIPLVKVRKVRTPKTKIVSTPINQRDFVRKRRVNPNIKNNYDYTKRPKGRFENGKIVKIFCPLTPRCGFYYYYSASKALVDVITNTRSLFRHHSSKQQLGAGQFGRNKIINDYVRHVVDDGVSIRNLSIELVKEIPSESKKDMQAKFDEWVIENKVWMLPNCYNLPPTEMKPMLRRQNAICSDIRSRTKE